MTAMEVLIPYLAFLFRLIPSLICWQPWKCRSMALFEGKSLPLHLVQQQVFAEVLDVFAVKFPAVQLATHSWASVLSSVRSWCRPTRIRLVTWCCPTQHVKLNTDGCSLGNPGSSGGGGVLRDYHGGFQVAFSVGFGVMHSLRAELKALIFGVRLALERGFHRLHIESDSLTLIRMLSGEWECPWRLARELSVLKDFKGYFALLRIVTEKGIWLQMPWRRWGQQERGSRSMRGWRIYLVLREASYDWIGWEFLSSGGLGGSIWVA